MHDLIVIGGGVNGCGIARDAAGRGLKVCLVEKGDLASGTSSASTKLIHGGLRYLEHYEFRLVREALIERETLLRSAPHIIWPLRFVLPHHRGMRPSPLLRLGLFLYDHLGGREILPGTRTVDLRSDGTGRPLKDEFRLAYEYSDCWVEDARLVVLCARQAAAHGADIRPRTRCTAARRRDGAWDVEIETRDGGREHLAGRALINAAGPWVSDVLGKVAEGRPADRIRLVKGSHIVVDRLYDHDRCYIIQNRDGRICFIIPYEGKYSLIGTTDEDYAGEPGRPEITPREVEYLTSAASEYLKRPVTGDMVRWSYAGIRPLFDDGATKAQEATRDYVLKLDGSDDRAPLLSVFGGKITTFRRLAEAVLEKLEPWFPGMKRPWTGTATLPGGDFAHDAFDAVVSDLGRKHAFLGPGAARRLVRAYGTDAWRLLDGARSEADMGRSFGLLSEREVDYLVTNEWAETAEDILWRRSKLGLHLGPEHAAALAEHLSGGSHARTRPAPPRPAEVAEQRTSAL